MGRSSRLALGAIAAAVAAGQVAPGHLGASIALATAAILLVAEARPRFGARALLPVVCGGGLIAIRLAMVPAGPLPPTGVPDGDGPWRLVVEATGSPRDGHQNATLTTGPETSPVFRVAATLPAYPIVVPGDQVTVDGSIRPRPDSPYGEYLLRIGAVGTLASRSLAVGPAPDSPGRRLELLRRGAALALTRVLPEPEAGLAAGILIGLRDLVDRDLAAAFTTAGVSHVVAISGWNIAIVAAAIGAMTGRLGRRRRSVVTIVAIVLYVAFAGASASVVRAALMAGVVLLARETGRAGRATAALAWAATILLVSDPALIGDAGFQLSSLATAGLIAWATPLTDWIGRLGGGRMPGWLAESLGVSLAAQAATLPIILVSFGRLAVLSPLVNLLVVPLVAPAMAVGIVALAGGVAVVAGAPPILGTVLAAPGWVILRLLVGIVDTAAGLPFASVTLEPPLDTAAAAVCVAGIAGVTWWRRGQGGGRRMATPASASPRVSTEPTPGAAPKRPAGGTPSSSATGRLLRRASLAALLLSLAVTGSVVIARPPGIARISILDVGQGDAILVEGSRGGRLLIDGGPDPNRLMVVLDARIPPWDRRIDAVILSHPHEDHVAGLALLLERYKVSRVFEPGMRGPGPGYAAWLRDLARPDAPVRLGLAAGDHLDVDDIGLRVLWPLRGKVPATPPDGGTGINNVSVVLLGQIGERRVLLMGDVEEDIDPSLLQDGLPHVDLLKVAHHGSRTATTQAFVDATRPTVAVASAGTGNPYGHPAKSTLDRLAASGAKVLRTDRDGTVVVGFEAGGMTVRAEGGRAVAVTTPAPSISSVAGASRRAPNFLCAIPVTALVPSRQPAIAATVSPPHGMAAVVQVGPRDPGWSGLPPGIGATSVRVARRSGRPCGCARGGRQGRSRRSTAGRSRGRHEPEKRGHIAYRCMPPAGGVKGSGTIEPMTVPGRVDAASLLLSLDPPPWFVRHARAVAEVAGWLAARIEARGIAIDRRLAESAALLHDADKALPADDPARALPHGDGSAAWLTRVGHPELARAVANHPVTRLLDGERYGRWSAFATREERIVAYADKRAGQRLETMEARFASWRRRYSPLDVDGRTVFWDDADLHAVRARADRLERDVCRAAGIRPDEVRRLGWTGPALRLVRGEDGPGSSRADR